MNNTAVYYRAEVSYRQDRVRRDWQPIRSRRARAEEARLSARRAA